MSAVAALPFGAPTAPDDDLAKAIELYDETVLALAESQTAIDEALRRQTMARKTKTMAEEHLSRLLAGETVEHNQQIYRADGRSKVTREPLRHVRQVRRG